MNSAFRPGHVWQQRAELSRFVIRAHTACPLVFVPALRHTTLEVIPHTRVDLLHLFERETDALVFRHTRNAPGMQAEGKRLQDAPCTWLSVRHIPDLTDGQVGCGKAA